MVGRNAKTIDLMALHPLQVFTQGRAGAAALFIEDRGKRAADLQPMQALCTQHEFLILAAGFSEVRIETQPIACVAVINLSGQRIVAGRIDWLRIARSGPGKIILLQDRRCV